MITTIPELIEEKRNLLQRIRDKFRANQRQRQANKQFQEMLEVHKNRVPRIFQGANPDEFKWTSLSFMLESFGEVLAAVPKSESASIMDDLKVIATSEANDERARYIQQRLSYRLFRAVTGEPYVAIQSDGQVRPEDAEKSNFLNLIGKGVSAYKKATPEMRGQVDKKLAMEEKKKVPMGKLTQELKKESR